MFNKFANVNDLSGGSGNGLSRTIIHEQVTIITLPKAVVHILRHKHGGKWFNDFVMTVTKP